MEKTNQSARIIRRDEAEMSKIVFLSGKITADPHYREKFFLAQCELQRRGYIVLNPAVLPDGMDYSQYMRICFRYIDVAGSICLLPDYLESPGSSSELGYATAKDKEILLYEAVLHDPIAEKM